jgi:putative PIN family toxin of toxin-antitoxin system
MFFYPGSSLPVSPHEILNAWRHGLIALVVSWAILGEYERVGQELQKEYLTIEFSPCMELLTIHGEMVEAPPLPENVCTDADDDLFLASALASGAKIVMSGDQALRKTSGYHGIMVLSARGYMEKYLKKGTSLPVENN